MTFRPVFEPEVSPVLGLPSPSLFSRVKDFNPFKKFCRWAFPSLDSGKIRPLSPQFTHQLLCGLIEHSRGFQDNLNCLVEALGPGKPSSSWLGEVLDTQDHECCLFCFYNYKLLDLRWQQQGCGQGMQNAWKPKDRVSESLELRWLEHHFWTSCSSPALTINSFVKSQQYWLHVCVCVV